MRPDPAQAAGGDPPPESSDGLRVPAVLCWLVLFALVGLSAHIRFVQSGLGCEPWPACYGRIAGAAAEQAPVPTRSVYQRLLVSHESRTARASRLHRVLASATTVLVLWLLGSTWRMRRRNRPAPLGIALALVGLTVFLSVIGLRSGALQYPAIVLGNLLAGMGMLALVTWMLLDLRQGATERSGAPWTWLLLALVGANFALGAMASARFAAASCESAFICQGQWWPATAWIGTFDVFRELEVGADGRVQTGAAVADLVRVHRLVSWIFTLTLVGLCARYRSFTPQVRARLPAVLVLASAQITVGIVASRTNFPVALAVLHHMLAVFVVLSVLVLYHASAGRGNDPLATGSPK